jgi:hypothetical protein
LTTVFAFADEFTRRRNIEKKKKKRIEVLSNQLEIEKEMTSKIIEVIFLKIKEILKEI